jgi:signal transduction histidine kinase
VTATSIFGGWNSSSRLFGERRPILPAILFFLIYFGLDAVSYIEPIAPFAITSWNPAVGLCVAAAALYGPRALLPILVAPLLADAVNRGYPLTPLYSVWVGMLLAAETALIVFGARWLRIPAHSRLAPTEIRILIATVPAALLTSTLHVGSLVLLSLLPGDQFLESIAHLWVGDIIGVLIVTPFCFLLFRPRLRQPVSVPLLAETIAQAVAVLAALWLIFGPQHQHAGTYFYVLFLPMIWIVLRRGADGAVVLNVFVQIAMLLALLRLGETEANIVLFQAMLSVFVISGLTLGWAVDQRKAATQDLRMREEELAASLKTAATSELAGTLAHELSHPIGAISNYVSALGHVVRAGDPDPAILPILGKLNLEIRRATDTVHHLRDFFRSGTVNLQPADLGELARESTALFAARGDTIRPVLAIQPGATPVQADRIQLHAVIHNLLINASDALQPVPPARRKLHVSVSREHGDAILAVDDSGPGVAADVRDTIFDGLTTTKKEGLGLGLSICRSIVQAHGGRITLEESGLGGARFVVTLPLGGDA